MFSFISVDLIESCGWKSVVVSVVSLSFSDSAC